MHLLPNTTTPSPHTTALVRLPVAYVASCQHLAPRSPTHSTCATQMLNTGAEFSSGAVPTNAWWENLVLCNDDSDCQGNVNFAAALPYVVDASGPVPGLRLSNTYVFSPGELQVQSTFNPQYGLTLGTTSRSIKGSLGTSALTNSVTDFGDLSVTMQWRGYGKKCMSAPIVHGMAYGTMEYFDAQPSIVFENFLAGGSADADGGNARLVVDDKRDEHALVKCDGNEFDVHGEIELAMDG